MEIQDDPQVVANGYLMDYDDGQGNATKVCSSPVQFDGEAFRVRSRTAEAGWDDIGRWKQEKVIS